MDHASDNNGIGSPSSPIIIDSPEDLAKLSLDVYNGNLSDIVGRPGVYAGIAHFRLDADLNMGQYEWYPIGDANHNAYINFDGNGHTINGLYIDGTDYVGLFGWFGDSASQTNGDFSLKNLTLKNCMIGGHSFVGGIAGYVKGRGPDFSNNHLDNVNITINGSGSANYVGGIVGRHEDDGGGYLSCTNSTFVGEIRTGSVSPSHVGGAVGDLSGRSYLQRVQVKATIWTGNNYVGGIVGSTASADVRIVNCIYSGVIFVLGNGGAILGRGVLSTDVYQIQNCVAKDVFIINAGGSFAVFGVRAVAENCSFVGTFAGAKLSGTTSTYCKSCYWSFNAGSASEVKKFTSESDDFSGFSVVPNMNGDLPIQNSLYSVAVGSTSEEVIAQLKTKGFTAV